MLWNAALIASKFSGISDHLLRSAAAIASGMRMHGALVIPSLSSAARQPPPWKIALQPRLVLATRHPLVSCADVGQRKGEARKGEKTGCGRRGRTSG